MSRRKVAAILEELSGACRESYRFFDACAHKAADDEVRQLLAYRARRYAENVAELGTLSAAFGDLDCEGPDLEAAPKSRWSALRKRVSGMAKRNLLQACEAQDSRVLVVYRDSFEYQMPGPIAARVTAQFGELIDHHARFGRLQETADRPAAANLELSAQL